MSPGGAMSRSHSPTCLASLRQLFLCQPLEHVEGRLLLFVWAPSSSHLPGRPCCLISENLVSDSLVVYEERGRIAGGRISSGPETPRSDPEAPSTASELDCRVMFTCWA